MTKKQRRQFGVGWAVALVVTLAGLTASAGVASAVAADDPSTPTAEASATPSATPTSESTALAENRAAVGENQAAVGEDPAPVPPATTDEPTVTPTPTTCPTCPPDRFTPRDGTLFNHPHNSHRRYTIRTHVLRTIRSVPGGGSIRIAAFSVNDGTTTNALIAARNRGVSVQVIVNMHNLIGTRKHASSPSFIHLRHVLGASRTRTGIDPERVSFAKVCTASCRGTGGNVHYKMFLFSSAGGVTGKNKPYITMNGSPNLTMLAARGQWNHLDTYSDKKTYDTYTKMFNEMRLDRRQRSPFRDYTTDSVRTWFFPRPGTSASGDPLMRGLNQIKCKGVAKGYGRNGRTFIRIGAYAWYENRGRWLSKKVRSLWNAGCDIAVEYAIMGNTVKKTLYNPSGRGRIPMRQVATFKRGGAFTSYDHAKYVTVSGHYGSDSSAYVTWTGTTNFSDLGFRSDDSTQVWRLKRVFQAYYRDFYTTYRERNAHVPSPTSRLPGSIGGRKITLGQGRYGAFEVN